MIMLHTLNFYYAFIKDYIQQIDKFYLRLYWIYLSRLFLCILLLLEGFDLFFVRYFNQYRYFFLLSVACYIPQIGLICPEQIQ